MNIERPTSNFEWEKMKTYDPGRKAANYCRRRYISNRSHSLAADRLLQGFNRGQIAPKCVFPTDYALKPEKGCWLSGGKVNNYVY